MSVSPHVLPDRQAPPDSPQPARAPTPWHELAVGQSLRLRVAGRTVRLTRLGGSFARIEDPDLDPNEAVHAELLDPGRLAPGERIRFRLTGSPGVETSAPIEAIEG